MTIHITEEPAINSGNQKEVILRTAGLSKRFGKFEAVKQLDLEIYRGEVFGFLGPNGAGKSTTVGMILGLVAPTSGSIELFGQKFASHRWEALRRIGAIIEEPAFYPYLSGWNNLEALAKAIGGISRDKITEVLERVNLLDRASDRYDHYSMGMKQRLGIASTLLRDPELIILDDRPAVSIPPEPKKSVILFPSLPRNTGRSFFAVTSSMKWSLSATGWPSSRKGKCWPAPPYRSLSPGGNYYRSRWLTPHRLSLF